MTMHSQNGWRAGASKADAEIDTCTVPGTAIVFPGGLKRGDAATVLLWLALQLHERVEPGVPGWCWGWNYRAVRGARSLSNHASGTALDWNAPRHPLGKVGTWNPGQVATIRAILAELDGVVRCGAFYEGRKDDMHFELVGSPAAVARVADRLRAHPRGAAPATPVKATPPPAQVAVVGGAGSDGMLRPGSKGADVVSWQGELWRIAFGVGAHDGLFGPSTEGCTLDLQRAAGPGIGDDGIVGPQTRDAARAVPSYPKAAGGDLPLCGPGGPKHTVGAFQQRLRDRGWNVTVDSDYGPKTAAVVRAFQHDALGRGFVIGAADGIGGPATWVALHLAPITR